MEAVPDGFVLHRQVTKILEDRHRMAAGAMPVNWGMAEVMAYATLVQAGISGSAHRPRCWRWYLLASSCCSA